MNKVPWFPKYINLENAYGNDIWVLRELITDHIAYYWKVSGEWGRKISYNGLTYIVENPSKEDICVDYLLSATPEEFLKGNPSLKTNWSKQKCIDAWSELKQTNHKAKQQVWTYSKTGYWYHQEEYYNNKFLNWIV